ncbi:hypothetical protein GCM10009566_43220 [Streptomyces murinus]
MSGWVRWITATVAVAAVFWSALLLGHWLPLAGPVDENARWGAATAMANLMSAVFAVPLGRWAESGRRPGPASAGRTAPSASVEEEPARAERALEERAIAPR